MKRFLQPSSAISLSRFSVCLMAVGLIATAPAIAGPLIITGGKTETTSVNYQGGDWSAGTPYTLNSGVDVTMDGPLSNIFIFTNAASRYIQSSGGGRFINYGTFQFYAGNNLALRTDNGVTIENQGLWDFVVGGGEIYANSIDGVFINGTNGTLRCSNGSAGPADRGPGGTFIDEGGRLEATNGATLEIKFGGTSGGINNSVASTVWDQTDGTISIAGSWSTLYGVAVGAKLEVSVAAAKPGGMKINITGEGARWNDGIMNPAGRVIENEGELLMDSASLRDVNVGVFLNSGTLIHDSAQGIELDGNGAIFANSGTISLIRAAGGRTFYSRNNINYFSNLVSGVIVQNVAGTILWDGTGLNGNFRNQGTIIVTNGGTFNIRGTNWDFDANAHSGGILLEGTWKVLGNLIMPDLGSGSLDTIGTNATVILSAAGVGTINAITEASLDTVYGAFGLHDGKTWTTGGTLTSDSGSNFEFGLNNSGTDAELEITGNSQLDGVVDVVDTGSLGQGDYVVITNSGGTTLTDNGIAAGTLTTSANLNMSVTVYAGVNGYVEVGIAPPPTGAVLFVE